MTSRRISCAVTILLAVLASTAAQVPEKINYQGRLIDGTNLYNGPVELSIRLYDPEEKMIFEDSNTVYVVDGLYSKVIGENLTPESGALAWALTKGPLTVEVLVNGIALSPREPLNAVGYAILAGGVTNGAISEDMLADGSVTGAKLGPASVTADKIDAGAVEADHLAADAVTSDKIDDGTIAKADVAANTFWATDGNTGTTPGTHFVGTTDNQPLDLRVNNTRAFRLQPGTGGGPHVVGGASDNACAGGYGGTIGGGGANVITGAGYAVIGGGEDNYVETAHAVIAGGRQNRIQLNAHYAAIGGGGWNVINPESDNSVIAGGYNNVMSNTCRYSVIGGGQQNTMRDGCLVGVIAGGQFNTIWDGAWWCSIGGGERNTISIGSAWSLVGGGQGNWLRGNHSVIAGGQSNYVSSHHSLAAGRRARCTFNGTFVWADSTDADFSTTESNQFLIRASGGVGIGTNVTPEALTVNGNVQATGFKGSGASLAGVNAAQLNGYSAGNAENNIPLNNGVLNTNLNADLLDGLHAGAFMRLRASGLVRGGSTNISIPSFIPFTLQLSSGHPYGGGLAHVQGFENDGGVGLVYTKYNGDGLSGHGGSEGWLNTTTQLLYFGVGTYSNVVRCPGDSSKTLVLQHSGPAELVYRLIY